jgi:hypothetical protein
VEVAHVQAPVVAIPVASDDDDDSDSDVALPVPTATATPTATPTSVKKQTPLKQTPKKAAPKKKAPVAKRKTPTKATKASPKPKGSPAASKGNKASLAWPKWALTLDDDIPDMTPQEYTNLQQLMVQFCRVPLLAEFSRPIALLHPEVR